MSMLDATIALTEREWTRLMRQPARIVATIGTPMIFLVALGAGFAGSMSGLMGVDDGRAYAAFLLPGMISMAALFASIFGAISLIEDRQGGFLVAILAGQAPKGSVVAAKTIGVGGPACAQACVMLLAIWPLGLHVSLLGLLGAILGVVLLTIGVVGFSLALAWRTTSTQEFHAIMNTVLMPMWLVSGGFYPAAEAAAPMRWLTIINPLTWPTEAIRASLAGDPSPLLGGWAWPLSIVFAIAGVSLAATIIKTPGRKASA